MNAKQSLRLAAKRIEELEYFNRRSAADIKEYNNCIDRMIAGGSPCDYCEDQNECQLQAKADGKGCTEWMLHDLPQDAAGEQEGGPADV